MGAELNTHLAPETSCPRGRSRYTESQLESVEAFRGGATDSEERQASRSHIIEPAHAHTAASDSGWDAFQGVALAGSDRGAAREETARQGPSQSAGRGAHSDAQEESLRASILKAEGTSK